MFKKRRNCRNNSERLFVGLNRNLRLISMCFKEFARMCELIYKIFEDLKEQECWWVIGSEQTLNYRGVSLQVKYKLKLILICFVKVNQHIWRMCINWYKRTKSRGFEDIFQKIWFAGTNRCFYIIMNYQQKTIFIPFKIHDEL